MAHVGIHGRFSGKCRTRLWNRDMSAKITTPGPLLAFYSHFPLKTLPAVERHENHADVPTLWIQPPALSTSAWSVDCLAAQALLALLHKRVALRTDITLQGGVDGRLPTLQLPDGQLLPAHAIANWAGAPAEDDEVRAWMTLLRSTVRPALVRTCASYWSNRS